MRRRIDSALMERLFKEHVPDAEAATIPGIKRGSLLKAQVRCGLREPSYSKIPKTNAQRERAQILLDEGLPIRWIAEDIGVSKDAIDALFPGPKADPEWVRVCASLIHRPRLLELHRSINA